MPSLSASLQSPAPADAAASAQAPPTTRMKPALLSPTPSPADKCSIRHDNNAAVCLTRSSDTWESSCYTPPLGLLNLGGTAYLNAALQLLLACQPFVQRLSARQQHSATSPSCAWSPHFGTGPLGFALKQAALYASGDCPFPSNAAPYNPQALLAAVRRLAPHLKAVQHHDSHEVLHLMLEGLAAEERCSRQMAARQQEPRARAGQRPAGALGAELQQLVQAPTTVERLFGGQLVVCISCPCAHQVMSCTPFLDLSLPLPLAKDRSALQCARAAEQRAGRAADAAHEGAGAAWFTTVGQSAGRCCATSVAPPTPAPLTPCFAAQAPPAPPPFSAPPPTASTAARTPCLPPPPCADQSTLSLAACLSLFLCQEQVPCWSCERDSPASPQLQGTAQDPQRRLTAPQSHPYPFMPLPVQGQGSLSTSLPARKQVSWSQSHAVYLLPARQAGAGRAASPSPRKGGAAAPPDKMEEPEACPDDGSRSVLLTPHCSPRLGRSQPAYAPAHVPSPQHPGDSIRHLSQLPASGAGAALSPAPSWQQQQQQQVPLDLSEELFCMDDVNQQQQEQQVLAMAELDEVAARHSAARALAASSSSVPKAAIKKRASSLPSGGAAGEGAQGSSAAVAASKTQSLGSLPPVLLLHIKRFRRDERGKMRKAQEHVAFELQLDLPVDCCSLQRAAQAGQPGPDSSCCNGHDSSTPAPAPAVSRSDRRSSEQAPGGSGQCRRYSLVGLIEHQGSLKTGRYVTYVRGRGQQSAAGRKGAPPSHEVGGRALGAQGLEGCEAAEAAAAAAAAAAAGPAAGGCGSSPPEWYCLSDAVVQQVPLSVVFAAQAYVLMYAQDDQEH